MKWVSIHHGGHQFEQIQAHPLILFRLMSSDIIIPSGIYVTLVVEVKLALLWVWVSFTRATRRSAFDGTIGRRLCDESLESWRDHLYLGGLGQIGLTVVCISSWASKKSHLHLTVDGGLVGNFSNALRQVSECLYTQIRQYTLIYWKSRCCHGKLWHLTTYMTQAELIEGGALETRLHLYWAKFPHAIEASHSLHEKGHLSQFLISCWVPGRACPSGHFSAELTDLILGRKRYGERRTEKAGMSGQ